MNIFTTIYRKIREVIGKVIPYKNIESVERVETTLSTDMINALNSWYDLYRDEPIWKSDTVQTMNLPAFISSEIARQVVLEMEWNITAKTKDDNGNDSMNPRAEYLKKEFERLTLILRQKLEQGCAAGGMLIKPYPNTNDGHIYFDWTMDWAIYPLGFDDDGNLSDVIIPDTFTDGKDIYTRLERHTVDGKNVKITQRAFRSNSRDSLGKEVPLTAVDRWASLKPEATVTDSDGTLFGWYKVAAANNIDPDSPMGASVFSKAVDTIREADKQFSRLLWEFEGSELAVDVDPTALRPRQNGDGMETAKLSERLFRALDVDKGDRDLYEVFSPSIRDSNLLNGLNQLLIQVEDLVGLSRGTLSNANNEARTATELKIMRQRSYTTVSDNQRALERCLKDVIRTMDRYATIYNLAPEGEYDVSFNWDDSILTDTEQQMNERLTLQGAGVISKAELRQWYFGETAAQAQAAIAEVQKEQVAGMAELLPTLKDDGTNPPTTNNPAPPGGNDK
ncbi:MAG: phage portal protein [Lachnospiraceae bacterium]|nr:phage portal protein [Lachnospiraceae bacterium]